MIVPSPVYAYSIAQQMRFVKGFLKKSLRFFEKVFEREQDLPERDVPMNKPLSLFREFL